MDRRTAVDVPPSLADLVDEADLREVVDSASALAGVGVAVVDRAGERDVAAGGVGDLDELRSLAGRDEGIRAPDGAGAYVARDLVQGGERLGRVVVGPYDPDPDGPGALLSHERAGEVARHVGRVLGGLLHAAHGRYLTTAVHIATMDEAFVELTDKNTRLSSAVERLREVDQLKSSFLAMVSHELRTPLTSIIGYSDILLEGLAGELSREQAQYVSTILNKGDQLLSIISSILEVSILESGTLCVASEPLVVKDLLAGVAGKVEREARRRDVALRVSEDDVPRAVGDVRSARQIFYHLLTNAVKFTPDGGEVAVGIEVGPLAPNGAAARRGAASAEAALGLRVVVRDTGIGIAEDMQARIFEPFFQVDSSPTREYGGTGLGLTLAKNYVEAQGGHIWVDSRPGAGSTFTVSLPALADDLEAHLAQPPSAQAR